MTGLCANNLVFMLELFVMLLDWDDLDQITAFLQP